MRNLNHQAVLDRVYQHFVIEQNLPGVVDGNCCYHRPHEGDPRLGDCPCAIGLFDDRHLLDDPHIGTLDVVALCVQQPDVLKDIFDVDLITREDTIFLGKIQNAHDFHALDASRKSKPPIEDFRRELADGLERIAREYGLKALAF